MDTRTYRAFSMAQALAAVRSDLGTDAVVLTTRSFKRGGFLGIGRRTIIEVTATRNAGQQRTQKANNQSPQPQPQKKPQRSARHAAAQNAYRPKPASSDTGDTPDRRKQLAVELLDELRRRESQSDSADQPKQATKPTKRARTAAMATSVPASEAGPARESPQQTTPASSRADRTPETVTATAAGTSEPVARRYVLAGRNQPAARAPRPPSQPKPQSVRPIEVEVARDDSETAPADSSSSDAMQRELSAIRSMVGRVLHTTSTSGAMQTDVPQQLFDAYLHLVSQDLSEDIADQVVQAVRSQLSADDLADPARVRTAVAAQLARCIPVAECPVALESPDERPLTIALVGPTGVGKTTTLAKLAASFKLRHERSVGLITCDTYRIAAVDQLRTYANIIGLPLEVVLTPSEMPRAMHALAGCDVILIDTAGRSQRDTDRLVELREFLRQADPHEVHLVLSSTASEKVLLQEAEAFVGVGAQKVVLTKLDEAVSFGMLVNVIRSIGRELSFFTTGQEVPDHIEIGRADRLADLMLAAE